MARMSCLQLELATAWAELQLVTSGANAAHATGEAIKQGTPLLERADAQQSWHSTARDDWCLEGLRHPCDANAALHTVLGNVAAIANSSDDNWAIQLVARRLRLLCALSFSGKAIDPHLAHKIVVSTWVNEQPLALAIGHASLH